MSMDQFYSHTCPWNEIDPIDNLTYVDVNDIH